MSPPIYTPDGSEVSEIVLPDGSTASEVIGPDGNVLFEAGPDIPDSGGAHQWTTDEGSGTTLADAIGSLDGTINGSTWTTGAGTAGAYLDYKGTSDYTDLGTASQSELSHFVNSLTGTLFAAVKPQAVTDDEAIFGSSSGGDNGLIFRFNSGNINIFLTTVGGTDNVDASDAGIVNDVWQAVGLVMNGSNYTFYHRNLEDNSDTLDQIGQSPITAPSDAGSLSNNVSIGRVTSDDSRHFDGGIDYSFTDSVAQSQSSLASLANDLESFYP